MADQKSASSRIRVSKACDHCSFQRSKCNGKLPCDRCVELGFQCEYKRKSKKRGRTSTKDLQQTTNAEQNGVQETSTASHSSANSTHVNSTNQWDTTSASHTNHLPSEAQNASPTPTANRDTPGSGSMGVPMSPFRTMFPMESTHPAVGMPGPDTVRPGIEAPGFNNLMPPIYDAHQRNRPMRNTQPSPSLSMHSSVSAELMPPTKPTSNPSFSSLRYPVLRPVLPFISQTIPNTLACDLLEMYFTSSTSAFQHPASPYLTGSIFRKNSFLRTHNPRQCSPALLASMLWIAAQTSSDKFFSASLATRGKVCQKLLELTIDLLKPLVHQPNTSDDPSNTVVNGVALGGFGVNVNLPLPGGCDGTDRTHYGREPSAEVDDIVTYIHLATVISASEYKAASMRWWSVVWSMVRELRFGHELPSQSSEGDVEMNRDYVRPTARLPISEETREERRRVWWLVYTVDRHLSLCYNQSLKILDVECTTLLRPVPEVHWQAGTEYHGPHVPDEERPRGPVLQCVDHNIFGFFTPIATVLGEVVDLQQARNHPRFGPNALGPHIFDLQATQIRQHLDEISCSLGNFRRQNLPDELLHGALPRIIPGGIAEIHIQTIIVSAYAEHLIHVMHVLLAGKWDPVSMSDDEDLWISSESFATASSHAIEAAEALSPILEYDPDLSFMPWFFGIYLLQGSFLLLLYADKLGMAANERVVGACERCVRAIEACVVTLNTEYQRTFRKVMRSALAQVKGRVLDEFEVEHQRQRRREALMSLRWTPDGRGLAI